MKNAGFRAQLRQNESSPPRAQALLGLCLIALSTVLMTTSAFAHAIGGPNAAFVAESNQPEVLAFLYLGAKHMVTGYDHLLFLVGVIFFLFRLKQILVFVTLFSLGHSTTLLAGVLLDIPFDPRVTYIVDAVIGFSVAYKAFDNLDGFRTLLGTQPSLKAAVFGFGLIHGLGLATKLQELGLNPNGRIINLISFNVGVEIGQFLALALILMAMTLWRRTSSFGRTAIAANIILMIAGFALMAQQLAGVVFYEGGAA